jgi:hypothetical protein
VADEYQYTMRQRAEFIARHLGRELEIIDLPYDVAWPCYPLYRHMREHRLCQSTLIRAELGYTDPVPGDTAMARTVEWLVTHPPEQGGEIERQVGDPFAYALEDELVTTWRETRASLRVPESPLPEQGHQYRHPKKPGEEWRAGSRSRPA